MSVKFTVHISQTSKPGLGQGKGREGPTVRGQGSRPERPPICFPMTRVGRAAALVLSPKASPGPCRRKPTPRLSCGPVFQGPAGKMDGLLSGVIFWALITRSGEQEILRVSPEETNVLWKIPGGQRGITGNLRPHGPSGTCWTRGQGPGWFLDLPEVSQGKGVCGDEPSGGEVAGGGWDMGLSPAREWLRPQTSSVGRSGTSTTLLPPSMKNVSLRLPLRSPGPSGLCSEHGGASVLGR